MSDHAFGSSATTAIFSVVIAAAITTLLLLGFFSFKYSLKAMFGVYDPVFKSSGRYISPFEDHNMSRIVHPYVVYQGTTYFLYGVNSIALSRSKMKKLEVLSSQQLNEFFPLKRYAEWLNGGQEEIHSINKGKLGYAGFVDTDHYRSHVEDPIESMPTNSENTPKEFVKHIETIGSKRELEEEDITDIPLEKFNYNISTASTLSQREAKIEVTLPFQTEKHYTSGICTICLENLEDDDLVRGLLCGHVFHGQCIDPWLTTRRGSCPICKKDLYLEVRDQIEEQEGEDDGESHGHYSNENPMVTINIGDFIRLPTGDPGSVHIDNLLNLDPSNAFSYFIVLMITKLEAQILLTATVYLRNHNYSLDNVENPEYPEQNASEHGTITFNCHRIDPSSVQMYFLEIASKLRQTMNTTDFKSPPLPDIQSLNPYIKRIVENHPRPFHPADITDLDEAALKRTTEMLRYPRRIMYFAIGINKMELYYYNVVQIYNTRRNSRIRECNS